MIVLFYNYINNCDVNDTFMIFKYWSYFPINDTRQTYKVRLKPVICATWNSWHLNYFKWQLLYFTLFLKIVRGPEWIETWNRELQNVFFIRNPSYEIFYLFKKFKQKYKKLIYLLPVRTAKRSIINYRPHTLRPWELMLLLCIRRTQNYSHQGSFYVTVYEITCLSKI